MKFKTTFTKFTDISIPKEMYNPIKTGVPAIDASLSELHGFIPSQVILLTGEPGAGKTTLCMYIKEKLAKAGRMTVMSSLEMSDFQLALQCDKMPGLKCDNVLISKDLDIPSVLEDLYKMKPDLFILDSIQKAAGNQYVQKHLGCTGNAAQLKLVELFTAYAKDTLRPVILIGHVSKNGKYRGPSSLKHEVDCHMHITYDREMQERAFYFDKNRFGGLDVPIPFYINSKGLVMDGADQVKQLEDAGLVNRDRPSDQTQAAPIAASNLKESQDNLTKQLIAFREGNKLHKSGIPAARFLPIAKTLLAHFQQKYAVTLSNTCIVSPEKIAIVIDKKKKSSYCAYNIGKIALSVRQYHSLTDRSISGYKQEIPYWQQHCNDTVDMAVWIVIHEFVHLLAGNQRHNKSFFIRVARFAEDNQYLFSGGQSA